MAKLKIARVGGGEQQEYLTWMAAIGQTMLEEVGVVDVNPASARRFGAQFGMPPYGSVEDLARYHDPDLWVVATPAGTHLEIVRRIVGTLGCRRKRIGIYLEKPAELTHERLDEMLDLARDAGVLMTHGLDRRYAPGLRRLAHLVRDGYLGDVTRVDSTWMLSDGIPARGAFTRQSVSGGGPGMDLGPHKLDMSLYVLAGQPVTAVSAVTQSSLARLGGSGRRIDPANVDVEDTFDARFHVGETAAGPRLVRALWSWDSPVEGQVFKFEVHGTEGFAALEYRQYEKHVTLIPVARRFDGAEIPVDDVDPTSLQAWRADNLRQLVAAVVAARQGREPHMLIKEHEVRNVLVALGAAYESAAQRGQLVAVPPR
jgi:predicted dehydrogenase